MNKIAIIVLVFMSSIVYGQQEVTAFLYAHNKGQVNGKQHIELKWFTQTVQSFGAVTLYRQQEGSSEWVKLNEQPVIMQATIPSVYKKQDKNLAYYEEIAKEQRNNPAKVTGIALLSVWVKAFESNPYAEFLGIYYVDSTAQTGITYRYKAVLTTRIKTSDLATSMLIKAEEKETLTAKPQNVQLKAQRKKVEFSWKEETTRFWAINIYRRKAGEEKFAKVNKNPIMASSSVDEKGNTLPVEKMYEDDSLQENTLYEYQLVAIDFFGYEGVYTGVYPIYLKDRTAPEKPKLEVDSINKMKVWLKWTPGKDTDLQGFHVYRGLKSEGPYERVTKEPIVKSMLQYYEELNATAAYFYFISAVDTAGNETPSDKVIANIEDVVPPQIPTGLTVKADTGVIKLSWKANLEKDLWGYYIYRGLDPTNPKSMTLMNANPLKDVSFNDTINKLAKNKFYYRIAAVDTNYNTSLLSAPLGAAMPDIIPPGKPYIKNVYANKNVIIIQWTTNVEQDLKGYHLYEQKEGIVEWVKITSELIPSSNHQYSFEIKEAENRAYRFSLSALDSMGNESERSEVYSYYFHAPVKENTDKDQLKLQAKTSKDKKTVDLKWKYSGKKAVKGYVLYTIADASGEPMALSGLTDKTSYKDKSMSETAEWKYEVRVYFTDGSILKSGYKTIEK